MILYTVLSLLLITLQSKHISGDVLLSPEQARKLNPETGLFKIQYAEVIPNKYKIQVEGGNGVTIGCYGHQEQGKWYPTNYIVSQGSYRVLSNLDKPEVVTPKSGQAFEVIFSEILPQCSVYWNEYLNSISNVPNLIPQSSNIELSTYVPPIGPKYSPSKPSTPSFIFLRRDNGTNKGPTYDVTAANIPTDSPPASSTKSTTKSVTQTTQSPDQTSTVATERTPSPISVTQIPDQQYPSTQFTSTKVSSTPTTNAYEEATSTSPIPSSTPSTQIVASSPESTTETQYSSTSYPFIPSTSSESQKYTYPRPTTTTNPSTDAPDDEESYYTVTHSRKPGSGSCASTHPGEYHSASASSESISTGAPCDSNQPVKLSSTVQVNCIKLERCTCTCPNP